VAGEEESLTSSSSLTIAEPMPFPLISSFTTKDASSKERSNLRICPMPRISPACRSAERVGQGGSACRPCECRGVKAGVGMEGEGGIVCAGRKSLFTHTSSAMTKFTGSRKRGFIDSASTICEERPRLHVRGDASQFSICVKASCQKRGVLQGTDFHGMSMPECPTSPWCMANIVAEERVPS
jgi:hypothetical protein